MCSIQILKSADGQYYFVLVAANNQVIATSETYRTKQSCKKGVASARKIAIFGRTKDYAIQK